MRSINRMITVQPGLGIKQDSSSKITRGKMAEGVGQVVETCPASRKP
jgi:hypothetical protein